MWKYYPSRRTKIKKYRSSSVPSQSARTVKGPYLNGPPVVVENLVRPAAMSSLAWPTYVGNNNIIVGGSTDKSTAVDTNIDTVLCRIGME